MVKEVHPAINKKVKRMTDAEHTDLAMKMRSMKMKMMKMMMNFYYTEQLIVLKLLQFPDLPLAVSPMSELCLQKPLIISTISHHTYMYMHTVWSITY